MDDIKAELVDELLKGYERPEDIIGENGLLRRLTKTLLERASVFTQNSAAFACRAELLCSPKDNPGHLRATFLLAALPWCQRACGGCQGRISPHQQAHDKSGRSVLYSR